MPLLSKTLLTLPALFQIIGPFLADYNHTHVLNPNWPPHAKFHNGQTMSMGLALGLISLYYTYRPTSSTKAKKDSITTAALIASVYWITAISAIFYPGTLAVDPEFGGAEAGFPQFWPFLGAGVMSWVGWWMETSSLERKTVKGA